jgi:hypothetical protein
MFKRELVPSILFKTSSKKTRVSQQSIICLHFFASQKLSSFKAAIDIPLQHPQMRRRRQTLQIES